MKKYVYPVIEITNISSCDVIATSGEYTITKGGDNGEVQGISWGSLEDAL